MPTPTYIVTTSFFIRDLNLPNTGNPAIAERINSFIAKYEPACLLEILGYPLFNKFGSESSSRMTELLNGGEYTDALCELQSWEGLKHDDNQSLIANYIYYYFQKASATQTTGVSTGVMKTEEGTSVSPIDKMISAWNDYSEGVARMSSFLWNKKKDDGKRVYPEFTSHQFLKTTGVSRKINFFGI